MAPELRSTLWAVLVLGVRPLVPHNLAESLDLLYRRTAIAKGLSMTAAIGIFGPVQKVLGSPQLLAPILAA